MGFKIDTKGLQAKIKRASEEMPKAVDAATKEHIEAVFAETKILVPKKTGALLSTGKVQKNETTADHSSYSIVYGGGEVDYAAAVHEILKASHAQPTQAKYVEEPLVASSPAAKTRITLAANKVKGTVFK